MEHEAPVRQSLLDTGLHVPLSPSGNNIFNLQEILAAHTPASSSLQLPRGLEAVVNRYGDSAGRNKRARDPEDDYDYNDGWIDDGSVVDGDEDEDSEGGEGEGRGGFFVVRGLLEEGDLLQKVKRLKRGEEESKKEKEDPKGMHEEHKGGECKPLGSSKDTTKGDRRGVGSSKNGVKEESGRAENVGRASGGGKSSKRGSSASKLPASVMEKIIALRELCVDLFDGKKPRLDRSEVQAALHEVFTSARLANMAKLHSDIAQDNRRIAIDDAVWSELSRFLRTTRAHLEPLGHALYWSEESERAKELAQQALERLKNVVKEMKGRIIWGEVLEDALLSWYEGRVEVLRARNQLSSRSNKVAKMLGKWITSMKADVFGEIDVVDKEIGEAITRAESRKKAKIRKMKEEKRKEKEREKARKKEEKEKAEKEKLKERERQQQLQATNKEKGSRNGKTAKKKKATASEILGRALGRTFSGVKKDGGLTIGRVLSAGSAKSKSGTSSGKSGTSSGKTGTAGKKTEKPRDVCAKKDSAGKIVKSSGKSIRGSEKVGGENRMNDSKVDEKSLVRSAMASKEATSKIDSPSDGNISHGGNKLRTGSATEGRVEPETIDLG